MPGPKSAACPLVGSIRIERGARGQMGPSRPALESGLARLHLSDLGTKPAGSADIRADAQRSLYRALHDAVQAVASLMSAPARHVVLRNSRSHGLGRLAAGKNASDVGAVEDD